MDNFDFDRVINRRGSGAIKWDQEKSRTGREGLLSFWVADMDFLAAPPIREALQRRLDHGIFGYSEIPKSLKTAFLGWNQKRHGWSIDSDSLVELPGSIPALYQLIQELTPPGEGVIIQEPVYYPFREAVENTGRKVVPNPLVQGKDGRWTMDLPGLEKAAQKSGARLLLLCSPHNPVARVWEKEELTRLKAVCLTWGLTVISDEIHADLVFSPCRHTPWLTLSEEVPALTLVSPTKTFNIPGLPLAFGVVPQKELRDRLKKRMSSLAMADGLGAVFSYTAAEAAWKEGEPWLEALLVYLKQNDVFFRETLAKILPEAKIVPLEGTYLEWVDLRSLGQEDKEIQRRLLDSGLWVSSGPVFGWGGEGHLRINIACSRSLLARGLALLGQAFPS